MMNVDNADLPLEDHGSVNMNYIGSLGVPPPPPPLIGGIGNHTTQPPPPPMPMTQNAANSHQFIMYQNSNISHSTSTQSGPASLSSLVRFKGEEKFDPNQTLYINNLNCKVKIEDLKKHLRNVFKEFGSIKDIVAMKSFWRRGQAYVVFDTLENATRAMNSLQGFPFFNKPMRIAYAAMKSDVIAKEDQTFVPRIRDGPCKPRGIREREEKEKALFLQMQQQFIQHIQKQMDTNIQSNQTEGGMMIMSNSAVKNNIGAVHHNAYSTYNGITNMTQQDKHTLIAAAQAKAQQALREASKRRVIEGGGLGMIHSQIPSVAVDLSSSLSYPNRTLFVENIPTGLSNDDIIRNLYNVFDGYLDCRVIAKRGVAFVDFTTANHSTVALHGTQGHDVEGSRIRVSYAK